MPSSSATAATPAGAPAPGPRLPGAAVAPVVAVVATAVWAVLRLVARTGVVRPWDADQRPLLRWGSAAVLVAVGAALALLAGRRRVRGSPLAPLLPALLVGLVSGSVSGLGTVALHGTRWSFNALYSDAGFRTEAVTRFADSPALADYGYRGLLSYYPPALPWVTGRLAHLVDVPGWTAVKPVALVLAAVVPLLAYAAWRRVLPDLPAALVVAGTTLATADLVKPDEWLVLAVVLPWWLEAVRDLRRPGVARAPAWRLGAVAGLLLLVHSYYFLPLALATVVAVGVDVLTRRPWARWPLRPRRALVIGAFGLLVASAYWLPLAVQRLRGGTPDDLQRRWSPPGFETPPLPWPTSAAGALGLVGVLWLLVRLVLVARGRPSSGRGLPGALAVLLATTYVFFVGGQLLAQHGVAVLPEKSDELLRALLVTSGVLGLLEAYAAAGTRLRRPGLVRVLAGVLVLVLALTATVGFTGHWLTGRPVLAAQQMRYPDGSYPAGGLPDPATTRHPWSVPALPTGPSTDEVAATWRRLTGTRLSDRTVLVTSRADLLATTPVHPFTAWKSIYSHPYGQFDARLALLRRVGRCPDARCAWELLRDNRFDRVDGLVLTARPDGMAGLTLTADRFPDGWVKVPVDLDPALLRAPFFASREVRGVLVVQVLSRTR